MNFLQSVMASSARTEASKSAISQSKDGSTNNRRRLDFSNVHYCGQRAELQKLYDAFDTVSRKNRRPSLNDGETAGTRTNGGHSSNTLTVIVEAPSGMGKTVLLDRFRAAIEHSHSNKSTDEKPFICRGKFEERTAASEPFAAIIEAVNELCEEILSRSCASASTANSPRSCSIDEHKQENFRSVWARRIREELGDEIVFLKEIFPKTRTLLDFESSSSCTSGTGSVSSRTILSASLISCKLKNPNKPCQSTSVDDTDGNDSSLPLDFVGFGNLTEKEWRFERFRLAFRALIRVVSTKHGAPLVLIWDDLHWVDPDSLTLLQTVLNDPQRCRSLLFIAATRPCGHQLSERQKLDQLISNSSSPVRTVHLENLTASDVACLLIRLLERKQPIVSSQVEQHPLSGIDDVVECTDDDFQANEDVVALANFIFEKTEFKETRGNSFAVLQLVRLLEQEEVIFFSEEEGRWMWKGENEVQTDLNDGIRCSKPCAERHRTDLLNSSETSDGKSIEDSNAMFVTQIVAKSLQRAPEAQRVALVTAAIFGVSHFEVTTIVHAITLLRDPPQDNECNSCKTGGNENGNDEKAATNCGTDASISWKEEGSSDVRYDAPGSAFLDGNCNYEDEEALDPFQVQARVRRMNQVLQAASRNGFVKETSAGRYKFTHDRVREAAYSLLPPDGSHAKQLLHLRIGRQLRSWMDQSSELGTIPRDGPTEASPTKLSRTSSGNPAVFFSSEESLLLHATKQLNLGANLITDSWEKLDLAEQNFLSAELAAKKTSFFPAMEYLEQGLKQLGPTPWEDHYSVQHKLSVALTRIQYSCGHFHDSLQTAEEILIHGKSFRDRQPVYHTKVLCLVQQESQEEAQTVVLNILDEIGHSFPRRFLPLNLVLGMRKVKALLRGMTDDDILNLPEACEEDDLNSAPSSFMLRLVEISFIGGNYLYFPMYAVRTLELTLERGKFALSPLALVSWGVIQVKSCKLQEASRFGRLAVKLSHRMNGRQHLSRARVGYWGLLFFWELPLRDGIKPLRQCFKEFWAFGALDHLFLDLCLLHRLLFTCGEPLVELAKEFERSSEFLLDYKQQVQWDLNAPLFQAVLNLIGDSGNTQCASLLCGKYIQDQSEIEKDAGRDWTTEKPALTVFQYQFFSSFVALFFGELERAESFLSEMLPVFDVSSDVIALFQVFYSGLVYVALYKRAILQCQGRLQRRKYKKFAISKYHQLLKWAGEGAVTCIHMHQLISAEKQAAAAFLCSTSSPSLAKEILDAQREYNRSIESAATMGLCHHEALANELAGAFFIDCADTNKSDKGNLNKEIHTETALTYLSRAVELYGAWGAAAKVKHVHIRYAKAFALSKVRLTKLSESTATTTLAMRESRPENIPVHERDD